MEYKPLSVRFFSHFLFFNWLITIAKMMGIGNPTTILANAMTKVFFKVTQNIGLSKYCFKIFEPCPRSSCNTFCEIIITKGKLDSIHRNITENQNIEHSWKKHNPKLPVFPEISFYFHLSGFSFLQM